MKELKEIKEENRMLNRIITGLSIILIFVLFILLHYVNETGVQCCINAGYEENYCREGLK